MIINLKLDAVNATVLDSALPEVTKAVSNSLAITLYDSDGVTPYIPTASSWYFLISNNYLPEVPVMVSVESGITVSENVVTVPLSALSLSSDELVKALSNQKRIKFKAALGGFGITSSSSSSSSSGSSIISPDFILFFDIYINNRLYSEVS